MKLVFRSKKILFCYQTIMSYSESAYKTLEMDTELLETYDKIFKEQLSLGYVEQTDTPSFLIPQAWDQAKYIIFHTTQLLL